MRWFARCARAGSGRLARRAGLERARERDAPPATIRIARVEPRRAHLAVSAGALSLAPRPGQLRGRPQRNLPGLEDAPEGEGAPRKPHRLPIPHRVRNSLNGY